MEHAPAVEQHVPVAEEHNPVQEVPAVEESVPAAGEPVEEHIIHCSVAAEVSKNNILVKTIFIICGITINL